MLSSISTTATKLDWTKFTASNTTGLHLPSLHVDGSIDIKAAGSLAIDLDGFVQVFGSFAFSKLTGIEVTSVISQGPSAGTSAQRTVDVMTFGLEHVNVFVGAGPYFIDADDDGQNLEGLLQLAHDCSCECWPNGAGSLRLASRVPGSAMGAL